MPAYYNEIDPYAAQWLRNLIAAGHVAPGDVDERSITDVRPDDLRGYDQCHFFAGIGGWSLALRLAGWPDARPVWTGSCPCQPFSAAGEQRGSNDERHLWPAFFDLIRECRPSRVFGEQVAGAAGYAWFDHVAADLEGEAYAAAAVDIGAHSVGAFHLRQRLYWVAHADNEGLEIERMFPGVSCGASGAGEGQASERAGAPACAVGDVDSQREGPQRGVPAQHRIECAGGLEPWAPVEWIACSDGKARPTQPGLFPLAHGIPNRVGRLRAYGNAIVPQVAAVFVMANAKLT